MVGARLPLRARMTLARQTEVGGAAAGLTGLASAA